MVSPLSHGFVRSRSRGILLSFEKEIQVRTMLGLDPYDLSCVLVVENIPVNKIEILCQSKTYDDVKEVLIEA